MLVVLNNVCFLFRRFRFYYFFSFFKIVLCCDFVCCGIGGIFIGFGGGGGKFVSGGSGGIGGIFLIGCGFL